MTEAEARSAMLVRAIELTDSAYAVWPREDRQWATDTALKDAPGAASTGKRAVDRASVAYIARRAAIACERLARDHARREEDAEASASLGESDDGDTSERNHEEGIGP